MKAYLLNPGWLSWQRITCSAGDHSSILGSGRSPGEGNGNPFQYPCLENSMDRGAWRAAVGHDWATKHSTELINCRVLTWKHRHLASKYPMMKPKMEGGLSASKSVAFEVGVGKFPYGTSQALWSSKLFWVKATEEIFILRNNSVSVQFSSVAQSCLTLCDPMDWSTPGLPVHHQLLELTQTHVHWVGDAIQPSHPLWSPSPPAPNPSHHQGLFKWVSPSQSIGVSASASVLLMNIQDWSPLGWTGWISLQSEGLSRVFSNTTVQKHQFFSTQLSL